jgi:hypothetical protein
MIGGLVPLALRVSGTHAAPLIVRSDRQTT